MYHLHLNGAGIPVRTGLRWGLTSALKRGLIADAWQRAQHEEGGSHPSAARARELPAAELSGQTERPGEPLAGPSEERPDPLDGQVEGGGDLLIRAAPLVEQLEGQAVTR